MAGVSEISINQFISDEVISDTQSGAADINYDQLMADVAASDLDHPSEGGTSIGTNSSLMIMENQGRRRHHDHSRNASDNPLVYQPSRTPRVPIVAPPSPPPRVRTDLKISLCFFFFF